MVNKLVDEIAPKYLERNGGYMRVIKVGARRGDGADVRTSVSRIRNRHPKNSKIEGTSAQMNVAL